MKLLIVLLGVRAGGWVWRRERRLSSLRANRAAGAQALAMVCCQRCGVHVPGNEVVTGREGAYCSAAHRRESEGA